jgi:enamine deaminase RidA (YjgF/YER057c/UK114 family)
MAHEQVVRRPSPFPGISESVAVTGGTVIQLSGAVGLDDDGAHPADFAVETDLVFRALAGALERAGAGFGDVVKFTVFIVGLDPDRLGIYRTVRDRWIDPDRLPASSVVGVSALYSPSARIEIEAIAVV